MRESGLKTALTAEQAGNADALPLLPVGIVQKWHVERKTPYMEVKMTNDG